MMIETGLILLRVGPMAGLCEGGNGPPGSLKAICKLQRTKHFCEYLAEMNNFKGKIVLGPGIDPGTLRYAVSGVAPGVGSYETVEAFHYMRDAHSHHAALTEKKAKPPFFGVTKRFGKVPDEVNRNTDPDNPDQRMFMVQTYLKVSDCGKSLLLAGNEFQSLGRAIVKEDEYEEVRWDGIVSIVSWRERVFRLWWEESRKTKQKTVPRRRQGPAEYDAQLDEIGGKGFTCSRAPRKLCSVNDVPGPGTYHSSAIAQRTLCCPPSEVQLPNIIVVFEVLHLWRLKCSPKVMEFILFDFYFRFPG
ncbi:hypothetical protein ANN_14687 [Periplaneta americana]|uniref:Per a allergen n=1 Tax=Periplaneta americana TaxID=6978 RepID=A0ABQ8SYD4_PERAM|nr:hypothetical protein ANN_14687 [Periplaneta americana]